MYIDTKRRRWVYIIIMTICYIFSLCLFLYSFFVNDITVHFVDYLVFFTAPLVATYSFLITRNHNFVYDKSKDITARFKLKVIKFFFVLGLLFHLLSYLYLYLELVIDNMTRLSVSSSSLVFASLLFIIMSTINEEEKEIS